MLFFLKARSLRSLTSKLNLVLGDLVQAGDLGAVDELVLVGGQDDPPALLLRDGEEGSVNGSGGLALVQILPVNLHLDCD